MSACGGTSDTGSPGSGSDDDSSASGYSVLKLVSAPGAGGTAASALTWLQSTSSQAEYAAQFRGALKGELTQAFPEAKPPAGEDLFASIVSIGCGVPSSAVVFDSFQGVVIQASPSPAAGCARPTTTVAVVAGPPPQ